MGLDARWRAVWGMAEVASELSRWAIATFGQAAGDCKEGHVKKLVLMPSLTPVHRCPEVRTPAEARAGRGEEQAEVMVPSSACHFDLLVACLRNCIHTSSTL